MRTKKYKEVKVFVTPALHRAMRIAAAHMGLPLQGIIRSAIGEWLDRQERAGMPGVPEPAYRIPDITEGPSVPDPSHGTQEVL